MKEAHGVLTLVIERDAQPALNGHKNGAAARNGGTGNGHHPSSHDTLLRV
jgi:hypothetical protein